MLSYEEISKATLKIECGSYRGTGFFFINPDIVVTNYHVLEEGIKGKNPIKAISEYTEISNLDVLSFSPTNIYDYAILKIPSTSSNQCIPLAPKSKDSMTIGKEIIFSGFPHGISDLLIQRAIISGFIDNHKFYLDGSVNGGNSGGPILDASDGKVIGIVTQRRFLGSQELSTLREESEKLENYCERISKNMTVEIMGINFASYISLISKAMKLIGDVIKENANTGIGIGYSIQFLEEECGKLGINN